MPNYGKISWRLLLQIMIHLYNFTTDTPILKTYSYIIKITKKRKCDISLSLGCDVGVKWCWQVSRFSGVSKPVSRNQTRLARQKPRHKLFKILFRTTLIVSLYWVKPITVKSAKEEPAYNGFLLWFGRKEYRIYLPANTKTCQRCNHF